MDRGPHPSPPPPARPASVLSLAPSLSLLRWPPSLPGQTERAREAGTLRPTKTLEDFGRAFDIPADYKEGAAFDKSDPRPPPPLMLPRAQREVRASQTDLFCLYDIIKMHFPFTTLPARNPPFTPLVSKSVLPPPPPCRWPGPGLGKQARRP